MTKKDDEREKQIGADTANQWDTDSRVKQASDALIGADFPSVMIQGKEISLYRKTACKSRELSQYL